MHIPFTEKINMTYKTTNIFRTIHNVLITQMTNFRHALYEHIYKFMYVPYIKQ